MFLEIGNLYGSFFFKFEMRFPGQQTAKNCKIKKDIMAKAEEGLKNWGAIPNRFIFLLFSMPSKYEGAMTPLAPLILAALHYFRNFFMKKKFCNCGSVPRKNSS